MKKLLIGVKITCEHFFSRTERKFIVAKIVNQALLNEMLAEAEQSPRRRAHRNFHDSLEDPIHRLLIGAMPDTVFPIHRHRDKFELLTVLRGRVKVTLYADDGTVLTEEILGPETPCRAMEIPAGTFHGDQVLEPAVMLEVKPGPYVPVGPEDTLTLR